ncbi:MAG: ribosome maturation factor RimM [Armatimonadota bacterium]
MPTEECDVLIGRVGPTFGRRGEVKVLPYTDHPEQFTVGEVCLSDESGRRPIVIERVWWHKDRMIVKFQGVDDMSAAEELRGKDIYIPESKLVPLAENEYYVEDLIGMEVVTTEGESLGKIKEVLSSPANDVYVTDRAMVPAVKEIVERVDVPEKRVIVRPVEGLLTE